MVADARSGRHSNAFARSVSCVAPVIFRTGEFTELGDIGGRGEENDERVGKLFPEPTRVRLGRETPSF